MEFAFHGVKQVVRLSRSRCGIAAMASSPAWGPCNCAIATARFKAMTGDGLSWFD